MNYNQLAMNCLKRFLTTIELIAKFNSLSEAGQNRFVKSLLFISNLKATQGKYAGKPLGLIPEQVDILMDIYGDLDEDQKRYAREVFILIGRKNGKTEFAAALSLNELFNSGEFGAEIYCAANTQVQATKTLKAAMQMIEFDKALRKRVKIIKSLGREQILFPELNSFIKAIGADAENADGFNAHMVVYDEIHESKKRDLYDKLLTSMGAREEPLFVTITTAGKEKRGIWYDLFEYGKKLVAGILQDKSFLPKLFYLDDEDDWKDEKLWYKANPALGIYRSLKEMRLTFKKALELPQGQLMFRRLYLNQIVDDSIKWIEYDRWLKCEETIASRDLVKAKCYGGLDLSSTNDLTSFCLCFPLKNGKFALKWWYFVPENNIQKRADQHKVPYPLWKQQGLLIATPGDTVDYEFIKEKIKALSKIYSIEEIAYDPWNGSQLNQDLKNEGFEMVVFRQNFTNMSPATKNFQIATLKNKICHGNNPISNWCASNMILTMDAKGNVMPDKQKSTEKIDGMIAGIIATDRAMRHESKKSNIETHGVREV